MIESKWKNWEEVREIELREKEERGGYHGRGLQHSIELSGLGAENAVVAYIG